jgi:glycosyltransferase involved in cell wall biosynthesis
VSAPHERLALPDDDVPTVAILGAVGPDKGARQLERMVALARADRVRIRFVLIGYMDVEHGPWQSDDARFTVHGRYEPRELPVLLARYRVRMVAFPSAGPETFSFTLSEAWAAGLPVVVPPFGALAERVGGTQAGWIFSESEWRDEARMLARIATLVAPANSVRLAAAGQAARDVAQPSLADMMERTIAHYARAIGDVQDLTASCEPRSGPERLGGGTSAPPQTLADRWRRRLSPGRLRAAIKSRRRG